MLGCVIGDVAGSVYEFANIKSKQFSLFAEKAFFTDDTVMSVAVAECLLNGNHDYEASFRQWGKKYPRAGYGGMFRKWLRDENMKAYNSWGNGSAMRVGPVGFACSSIEEGEAEAKRTAEVTHNHPEGIKGAQATASAIFLARQQLPLPEIKSFIEKRYGYDLSRSLEEIRPQYDFDVSCGGTVPEAIIAFLESTGFEDAIRNAISLGGDSDTLACITGGIAEAYYGIPAQIEETVQRYLSKDIANVVKGFQAKYRASQSTIV